MSDRPPRSIDVARRAGVSRATVSHILNGQGARFSPETVERVRQTAVDMGYVPSAAGRALVRGRSDIVMIVLPFTTMPGLQDLVDELSEGLAAHGFNTVVQLAGPVGSEAYQRLRHVGESLRPAGVIDLGGMTTADHDALRRLGSPVVGPAIDADGAGSNIAFGRLQVEHLVDRGYSRVAYAFLTDERGHPWDQGRAEGAREACALRGLPEPYLFAVPLDPEGAINSLATMLKSLPAPVGVACFNDDVGLAVLYSAAELGLEVPAQLGVVGLGRTPLSQLSRPRLTSVWSNGSTVLTALLDALLIEYGGTDQITQVDLGRLQVEQGGTT